MSYFAIQKKHRAIVGAVLLFACIWLQRVSGTPVRLGTGWLALRQALFFFRLLFLAAFAVFFIALIITVCFPARFPSSTARRPMRRPRLTRALAGTVCGVMAAVFVYALIPYLQDLPDALGGHVSVASGTVQNVVHVTGRYHRSWQFTLSGRHFTTSDNIVWADEQMRVGYYPHSDYLIWYDPAN